MEEIYTKGPLPSACPHLLTGDPYEILLTTDMTDRILEASPAASRYGFSSGELLSLRVSDLTLETPEGLFHRCKGGELIPVEVSAVQMQSGRLYLVRDVTGRWCSDVAGAIVRGIEHLTREGKPVREILNYTCDRLALATGCPRVEALLPDGCTIAAPEAPPAGAELSGPSITIALAGRRRSIGTLTLCGTWSIAAPHLALGVLVEPVAHRLAAALERDRDHLQALALESAATAVTIVGRNGEILWVNEAFEQMTGYKFDEAVGQGPSNLRGDAHSAAFYDRIWSQLLAGQVWHGELQNRTKDGRTYIEEQTIAPVRDGFGNITHFIALKQDATERRRQEQQLIHLALHDPLTGLPNRRAWEEALDKMVNQARLGQKGALLLVDLDRFKEVNDTYGHLAGDQFLKEIARCMNRALRRQDLLARLGGDEFGVLMSDVNPSEALIIAERLRCEVQTSSSLIGGQRLEPTLSIGMIPVSGGHSAQELVGLADAALYAAKEQGRNRTVLRRHQPEIRSGSRWANRIRRADRAEDARLAAAIDPGPVVSLDEQVGT